jgi:hypothetical protein
MKLPSPSNLPRTPPHPPVASAPGSAAPPSACFACAVAVLLASATALVSSPRSHRLPSTWFSPPGAHHGAGVSADGALFVWGSDSRGQLGRGWSSAQHVAAHPLPHEVALPVEASLEDLQASGRCDLRMTCEWQYVSCCVVRARCVYEVCLLTKAGRRVALVDLQARGRAGGVCCGCSGMGKGGPSWLDLSRPVWGRAGLRGVAMRQCSNTPTVPALQLSCARLRAVPPLQARLPSSLLEGLAASVAARPAGEAFLAADAAAGLPGEQGPGDTGVRLFPMPEASCPRPQLHELLLQPTATSLAPSAHICFARLLPASPPSPHVGSRRGRHCGGARQSHEHARSVGSSGCQGSGARGSGLLGVRRRPAGRSHRRRCARSGRRRRWRWDGPGGARRRRAGLARAAARHRCA